MLPKYHQQYTKEILKDFKLSMEKKKQIIIGSIVNDYCELTNDGNIFNIKDTSTLFFNKDMLKGDNAFYQSHFGYLTSLHFMSKKAGESAEITRDELKMWFKFLNNVAAGRLTIPANAVIADDEGIISDMFRKDKIKYNMIFDSDRSEEIRYRALGMMLHLIQDSMTPTHCERNGNNEIVQFYYYGAQDSAKHSKTDNVLDSQKEFLFEQCRECVKSVIESKLYKTNPILTLSGDTKVSSGGEYA